ncbi:MAG: hypothetical protein JWL96_1974 [Sphingomonas bacterium]|nr:hypothetical protein [Sphingomonas bacterium]
MPAIGAGGAGEGGVGGRVVSLAGIAASGGGAALAAGGGGISIPDMASVFGSGAGRAGISRGARLATGFGLGAGRGFAFGAGLAGIFIPGMPGIDCAVAGTGKTAALSINNARFI